MKKNVIKMLLFLTVALLAVILSLTYALTNVTQPVSSSGIIVGVPNLGTYSNSACTQALTSVSWGNVTIGGTASYPIWVKNTGTANMTLSMTASGWSPTTASQYITLSWNQNKTVLTPNQVAAATLTLTVSASIPLSITTFSNTITITGTG